MARILRRERNPATEKTERITLPWGEKEQLPLQIPGRWRVVSRADVRSPAPIRDVEAAVRAGLEDPIGSSPLRDLVDAETSVALVMDDAGRPTPVRRLAPAVLEMLLEAGARREQIVGLFAVGAHRVMSAAEMRERVGCAVTSQIECRSFDCRDEDNLVHLGRTRRGTPVYLNRLAAEADLRILVGGVEPHPQAGFGGGFKNLVPGLAGARTIGHNHLLMPSAHRYNMIGTLPDDNPMRLDLEEAGRMAGGPTLIVNVVLDGDLSPVEVVCGDAVAAHRKAVATSRGIFGVRLPRRVDVVVSSAYPMGAELRQAGKGILNVAGACRPGGVIIAFMRCERGLGDVSLPPWSPPLPLARALARLLGRRQIAWLARRIPGPAPEDRFMINFGLQILRDFHVFIFSPCLKQTCGDRFPPVVFDDQRQLFERVARMLALDVPEVAVFRQGGVSFPIIAQQNG